MIADDDPGRRRTAPRSEEPTVAGQDVELVVDGTTVATVELADTAWDRFRGLLWRRHPPAGLLLRRSSSVHGVGMTYSLDVALLTADDRVTHVLRLRPFGATRPRRGVKHVLEARAGSFAQWGLQPGVRLEVRPVTGGSASGGGSGSGRGAGAVDSEQGTGPTA